MRRIGVVGAGLMGAGIAEVCARAGCEVLVAEADESALGRGRDRVEGSLARATGSGKLDEADADAARGRLTYTTDLGAFGDRELVVEAVAEDERVKLQVFSRLDEVLGDGDAVVASNTSSIPIMKLAMAMRRPERVLGLHFFNPVPVMSLVELIPSLLTDDETERRARAFAEDTLGKSVVRSQDRAGFVVNALLIPYLLAAIRMLESGFASAEDIDDGMVRGCAHPMGPLHLTDLIGLDTTKAVAESMYAEFKEQLYSPPPLLSRMVDAGLLGRKSGQGFFGY